MKLPVKIIYLRLAIVRIIGYLVINVGGWMRVGPLEREDDLGTLSRWFRSVCIDLDFSGSMVSDKFISPQSSPSNMRLIDLTFSQPEMNLALDEALLEEAEETGWQSGHSIGESLRFWEPDAAMVVIGRSSSLQKEVNLEFCQQNSIPVMRRCSGGATVVTAPGCLMYALLIPYVGREELRSLDNAHQFVIGGMIQAIARLGIDVEWEGTCDLTIEGKKVSGNSLRCRRQGFLYHGTMICRNFELDLVTDATHSPQRQPQYRNGRPHREFLTKLPCTVAELKQAIQDQWQANDPLDAWPQSRTFDLARTKYSSSQWTNQIG